MNTSAVIILLAAATAAVSGLFGMGGGMIFMGLIAVWLPVAAAMVVHGIVQGASNGFRAWLLWSDVRGDVLRWELVGAVPAAALLAVVSFVPGKLELYLVLGLLPALLWLPKGVFAFDAARPRHAVACGAMVTGLNLSAGVAGPALDFFFVRTNLTRQEIVATKAVTMLGAHLLKVAYFGAALVGTAEAAVLPAWWVFALAVPGIALGTWVGTRGLALFSDGGFRQVSRYLVTVVGAVFLLRAWSLFSASV